MKDINYKVYYINLKHRKDRQYSILQQLHNAKIPLNKIHRINAVQHKLGAFGCLLSHIKTLKRVLKDGVDTHGTFVTIGNQTVGADLSKFADWSWANIALTAAVQ